MHAGTPSSLECGCVRGNAVSLDIPSPMGHVARTEIIGFHPSRGVVLYNSCETTLSTGRTSSGQRQGIIDIPRYEPGSPLRAWSFVKSSADRYGAPTAPVNATGTRRHMPTKQGAFH